MATILNNPTAPAPTTASVNATSIAPSETIIAAVIKLKTFKVTAATNRSRTLKTSSAATIRTRNRVNSISQSIRPYRDSWVFSSRPYQGFRPRIIARKAN
jgi:hypothetical protein